MIIDGFTDELNDRFTNSSSFIANGLDLSGVGRTSDDGRWGTLISRNAVLTARHRPPNVGASIFFYESNDPNGTRHEAIITGGQPIGGTDLYISFLDRNVNSAIKVYDFATTQLSSDPNPGNSYDRGDAGIWQDRNAYMVGVSATDRDDREEDIAVGRNLISGYDDDVPFLTYTNNDILSLVFDSSTSSDFTSSEAFVQGGDSGAPLFVEDNGELILLGINSFQINIGDPVTLQASGITYTGNRASNINDILTSIAIPEPNSTLVACVLLGMTSLTRRRRSS